MVRNVVSGCLCAFFTFMTFEHDSGGCAVAAFITMLGAISD